MSRLNNRKTPREWRDAHTSRRTRPVPARVRRTCPPPSHAAAAARPRRRTSRCVSWCPSPPTFSPSDETASASTPPLTAPDFDAPDAASKRATTPSDPPRVPTRAIARPQDELEPLPAPAPFRRPASASPKGPSASRINGGALRPLSMHQNSSQVANMLNPVTGLRDAQRRAGLTPVNHARDNLLAIKELSLKNKARKEAEAATKAAPFRARPAPSQTRSRPASARVPRESPFASQPYGTDFVRANKTDTIAKASALGQKKLAETARSAADAKAASPLLKAGYGRVPEYVLRRRREEEEKRVEAEKEKALVNVPAGMRVMPEDEREATLAILRANREDVEAKLAAMPIAVGKTQTSLRRKAELETRLAEIEDAQRVFQRRVVLVRDE